MSNICIHPIDRTLSGAITLDQSEHRSVSNKVVHCIPQSSGNSGASQSDSLESYTGHSLEVSATSSEMQSVHSTAPADLARI